MQVYNNDELLLKDSAGPLFSPEIIKCIHSICSTLTTIQVYSCRLTLQSLQFVDLSSQAYIQNFSLEKYVSAYIMVYMQCIRWKTLMHKVEDSNLKFKWENRKSRVRVGKSRCRGRWGKRGGVACAPRLGQPPTVSVFVSACLKASLINEKQEAVFVHL